MSDAIPAALGERVDLLLCRVSGAVARRVSDALAPIDLNAGHHTVLRALTDDGPHSQQHLSTALRIDRTTMVGLIDVLEDRALVRRERNVADRRAYDVHVTPAGRDVLRRADRIVSRTVDELFAPLGEDGVKQLDDVLARLIDGGHLPGFER